MNDWWATDEWLMSDWLMMIYWWLGVLITYARTYGRTTLVVKSLSRLKKIKKSQITAHFILMKYENANPWFCSKCSPSLAGKLWSCNFSVLLKGQIFWRICSVFPAIFAAILLLNVGGICNYGNYITVMTFCEKKSEKIARKRKIKEIF